MSTIVDVALILHHMQISGSTMDQNQCVARVVFSRYFGAMYCSNSSSNFISDKVYIYKHTTHNTNKWKTIVYVKLFWFTKKCFKVKKYDFEAGLIIF